MKTFAYVHGKIFNLLKVFLKIFLKEFLKKFQKQSVEELLKESLKDLLNKSCLTPVEIYGDIFFKIPEEVSGRISRKSPHESKKVLLKTLLE